MDTFILSRYGYRGAVVLALAMVVCFLLSFESISFVLLLFLALWLFMFRNPERAISRLEGNTIFSPVDGRVLEIQSVGNKTIVKINVRFFDIGIIRAPVSVDNWSFVKKSGLFLYFTSLYRKKILNSYARLDISDNLSLKLYPELFNTFCVDIKGGALVGERIGFMKMGFVVMEIDNIELKINVGDNLKGGISPIGYIQ